MRQFAANQHPKRVLVLAVGFYTCALIVLSREISLTRKNEEWLLLTRQTSAHHGKLLKSLTLSYETFSAHQSILERAFSPRRRRI